MRWRANYHNIKKVFSEELFAASNRIGFMRRYFNLVAKEKESEQHHSTAGA
jgi:hypothetical protein